MAKKKLRQRNTRRNVAPFYKGAIFILVALYIVMFVYGKVKPDPEDKMASKTYKEQPI